MKKYLVDFATPNFSESQNRLNMLAKKFGVDEVLSYTMEDLKGTKFFEKNKAILTRKKGAGYYLWKPYVILDAFKKIKTGDILFYCDSGVDIISSLQPIFNICIKEGICIFSNPSKNREWVKRDCFYYMGCDSERYWNAQHISATHQAYLKSKKNIDFVKEWLKFCEDPRIITDDANVCGLPNRPEFVHHIYDQAVLAVLVEKHRIKIYPNPQSGTTSKEFPNPIFFHHRMQNRSFSQQVIFKIKLITPVKLKDKIKWFINQFIKR